MIKGCVYTLLSRVPVLCFDFEQRSSISRAEVMVSALPFSTHLCDLELFEVAYGHLSSIPNVPCKI